MAEPSRFTTCQLALNGNLRGVVNKLGAWSQKFRACPLLLQILDPPLLDYDDVDREVSCMCMKSRDDIDREVLRYVHEKL